jgi:biotin/methionine sulfoxide reductase
MHRAVEPVGQARDDHAILAALADRLGFGAAFTEGRTPRQWLRHLYDGWRDDLRAEGHDVPDFDAFWAAGEYELPPGPTHFTLFEDFRAGRARLRTPSGRIELYSETVAGFGYPDCPGHPAWLEPDEWLGAPAAARFPLLLIANQPATRLHSQLDVGATSLAGKRAGREALHVHPLDAAERGIADGDVVRVFNDRGACLAGVILDDGLRPGVVRLPTGAWFDPVEEPDGRLLCVHGNPNVLTGDVPSSRLSQGCTGQHALVEVAALTGPPPPVTVHHPPPLERIAS